MARHPSTQHLIDLFTYEHLPDHLQAVSVRFHDLAVHLADSHTSGPEQTVAIRKLLEAKDAAVRHAALTNKEED